MMRTVLVIPGHVGATTGAAVPQALRDIAGSLYRNECELNYDLTIATIRGATLCGWTAVSTIGSFERKALTARLLGVKAVIEIHCNASENAQARGAEIWYDGDGDSYKLAQAVIQRWNLIPLREPPIRDMRAWSNDRRALFDHVRVRPCVLIECGFVTNRDDLALLVKPSLQRALGLRIAQGVALHFDPTMSFPDEWVWYA